MTCSGLVHYTVRRSGAELLRVRRDQARAGRAVASLGQARPGDLTFGSPVDHIGINAGATTTVVAPLAGDVIKVQQITRTPAALRRVV
ncbi:MAG TPA: NlpC/P60 family protein [Euzebyales bacterium]|nr:NlpC/P60 family protein [Euzebyales bacterium]